MKAVKYYHQNRPSSANSHQSSNSHNYNTQQYGYQNMNNNHERNIASYENMIHSNELFDSYNNNNNHKNHSIPPHNISLTSEKTKRIPGFSEKWQGNGYVVTASIPIINQLSSSHNTNNHIHSSNKKISSNKVMIKRQPSPVSHFVRKKKIYL